MCCQPWSDCTETPELHTKAKLELCLMSKCYLFVSPTLYEITNHSPAPEYLMCGCERVYIEFDIHMFASARDVEYCLIDSLTGASKES